MTPFNYALLALAAMLLPSASSFSKPSRATLASQRAHKGGVDIIGGTEVPDPATYSFMASIREDGESICGGSIIANQWIITAAHCVIDDSAADTTVYHPTAASKFSISVGTLRKDPGEPYLPVSEAYYDWRYNSTSMEYDIALLKLAKPLRYSSTIGPLKFSTGPPLPTDTYTAIGFGVNNVQNRTTPANLLQVSIPASDPTLCDKVWPGYLQKNMVCAEHENADTCWGDSGGPLMRNENSQWKLVGLTSFGQNLVSGQEGCGGAGDFGYYTWAYSHMDFVSNVTGIPAEQFV